MKHLTNKQYVKKIGLVCPVCRGEDIEGGPIEVDAGTAWQPIKCNTCGSTWNDLYNLMGYSDLACLPKYRDK